MNDRMSDMDELVELRRLLAEATQGEWFQEPDTMAGRVWVAIGRKRWPKADIEPLFQVRNEDAYEQRAKDAALIVAAVNTLPALLERVEAAEHPQRVPNVHELWKAAVEDRDDAIALMSDLLLRTPAIGDDKDGFIAGYVMPTGPLHRIASYLTQHGQSFVQSRHYAEMKSEHEEVVADRDALAAKVADAGERIAQAIEASCDAIAVQPCRPCRQAAHIARAALDASETP